MVAEKDIMCRLCKSKIKGEAYAVHKRLCNGSGSSYSVMLNNVNNYERPGRERCSQLHRYRPSADRPRRSKSVPPKAFRQCQVRAKVGELLASHQRGRVSTPAVRCHKRTLSRSKSIPPPEAKGRVGSAAKSRRRLPPGTKVLDGVPTESDASAITPQSDSTDKRPVDSRVPGLCNGDLETTPIRMPSQSTSIGEDDRSFNQTKNCDSSNGSEASPRTGHSLSPPSAVDSIEITRLGIDNYKPFFFDSETVPPSLEVSRRRFHGGRRGSFCCKVGCSCRRCHYFSLSLVGARQYPFLRRCNADCPCSKCHLTDSGKLSSSSSSGFAKKSGSSSSATSEDTQSPSLVSPGDMPPWDTPKSVRRRSSGRSRSCKRRAVSSSKGGDANSGRSREEKGGEAEKKDQSETEGESPSPKGRRERKEVRYHCEPCGKEIHSWSFIRRHIMSSEHLKTVTDERNQEVRSNGTALDGNGGVPENPVEEAISVMTACPRQCNPQGLDYPDETSLPPINISLSPKRLLLRYAQSKASQLSEGQQSTFIRVDYKKKPPAPALRPSCGKPSSSSSQVEGVRSVKSRVNGNSNNVKNYQWASVRKGEYICFSVPRSSLPKPFVDLGVRCEGETTKKMIRMDYTRKPGNNSGLRRTPSLASLTDQQPTAPSMMGSETDEEGLREPLVLYDSEEEDSKEGILDVALMDQSGEQVLMLDSQSFLSRFVKKLNDGGLCCHSCGCKIDGNNIVAQLYKSGEKPQPLGCSE